MRKNNFLKILILCLMAAGAIGFISPIFAASEIKLSTPLLEGEGALPSLPDYIRTLYRFALSIAGLLAVGMIVLGGIEYTASESITNKQDAKDRIVQAVYGLILLVVAVLILNAINPELAKLNPSAKIEELRGLSKIEKSRALAAYKKSREIGDAIHRSRTEAEKALEEVKEAEEAEKRAAESDNEIVRNQTQRITIEAKIRLAQKNIEFAKNQLRSIENFIKNLQNNPEAQESVYNARLERGNLFTIIGQRNQEIKQLQADHDKLEEEFKKFR